MQPLGLGLGLGLSQRFSQSQNPLDVVDLSALTLIADYKLYDSASLFSDTARTTPAVDGGSVKGIKDSSGNSNHATIEHGGGLYLDGAVSLLGSQITNGGKIKATFTWDYRNVVVIAVWEPVTMNGCQSSVCYIATNTGNSRIFFGSAGSITFNGNATGLTLPCNKTVIAARCNATNTKAWNYGSTGMAAAFTAGTSNEFFFAGDAASGTQGIAPLVLHRLIVAQAPASDSTVDSIVSALATAATANQSTTENWFITGDSVAFGWGADGYAWPRLLKDLLSTTKPRVFNAGYLGLPTGGGATVPTPIAAQGTISKLFYSLGLNDINGTRTLTQMQTDVAAYITARSGITVYPMTIHQWLSQPGARETIRQDYNTWLKATYANTIDVDGLAGIVAGDYYDNVHLKRSGQQKIADLVKSTLGLT